MSLGRRSIAAERFRLRFGIKPPAIDIEDPWAEEPQFDPYTFTLLTQAGPVEPARWATFGKLAAEGYMAWPATLWSRSRMSFQSLPTGKLLTAGALSLSGHPRPSGTPCASE